MAPCHFLGIRSPTSGSASPPFCFAPFPLHFMRHFSLSLQSSVCALYPYPGRPFIGLLVPPTFSFSSWFLLTILPPFTAPFILRLQLLCIRIQLQFSSVQFGSVSDCLHGFVSPFSISIFTGRLQLLLPISLLQIIYMPRVYVGTLVNSLACFMALLGVRSP